ncbi:hypothetical protein CEXT_348831 [Caerostris extrusa]|uniref:Uncharacterized protein n=1 Tax=Caerostris extrusa TaxID=172846 RepID=A0AAV4XQI4_CAEEX|nr:hypothetical protein CEXT_348831 [Caerostris extrusa]
MLGVRIPGPLSPPLIDATIRKTPACIDADGERRGRRVGWTASSGAPGQELIVREYLQPMGFVGSNLDIEKNFHLDIIIRLTMDIKTPGWTHDKVLLYGILEYF